MKPSKGSWNGEFRGFRICVGWISTTRFVLWVFMCPTNIILFHGYHAEGYHAPSLPPRAITPVYACRLSRHSSFFYSLVITPELSRSTAHTRTSGYHTRHSSSYFVFHQAPAISPPVLLHLHHHRGATRTNLLHKLYDINSTAITTLSNLRSLLCVFNDGLWIISTEPRSDIHTSSNPRYCCSTVD